MWRRVGLLIIVLVLFALATGGSGRGDADWAALIQRGDSYRSVYLYTAAADQYRLALDRRPSDPVALLRLCDVSVRLGFADEAVVYADRAERAGADLVDAAECRARVAESQSQPAQAAKYWSIVAAAQPSNRAARLRLIEALIGAHDWPAAEQILRAMLATDPGDTAAADWLTSLLALEDPLQARSVVSSVDAPAGRTTPDNSLSFDDRSYRAVAIGRVFLEQERLALAWRAFVAATAANPGYADAFAYLGITYDRLGDATLAEAFLDRALELNPQSAIGLYLRGVYASRHAKWADARTDLEQAAQIDPDNVSISVALGRVLTELGEYAAASGQLVMAAAREPNNPAWHLALAELHIGRLTEVGAKGVPAARRAVELAPTDAHAHTWLGWGLHLTGADAQAEAELRAAVSLDPALARARLHLGNFLIDTGRVEEGRTELQRAADLDPRGPVGARARQLLGAS